MDNLNITAAVSVIHVYLYVIIVFRKDKNVELNDKNDMLTVIIPVYNAEKYLKECVDSVLASTYSNLEVILVDDASTDRSPEICDDYAKKDIRVTAYHVEHGDRGAARNYGITHMHGRFLTFVDNDDYVYPDMYERLIRIIEEEKVEVAVCDWDNYYPETDSIGDSGLLGKRPIKLSFKEMKISISFESAITNGAVWVWNKVIDYKTIKKKYNGEDVLFRTSNPLSNDDRMWLISLYQVDGYAYITDYKGYRWRIRGDSTSRDVSKFSFERAFDVIESWRYAYPLLLKENDIKYKKKFYTYYCSLLFYFVLNHRDHIGDPRVVGVWKEFRKKGGLRPYDEDGGYHVNPFWYYARYIQFSFRFRK